MTGHLWGNPANWKVLQEEPRSQVTITEKNKVLLEHTFEHLHQETQHAKYSSFGRDQWFCLLICLLFVIHAQQDGS